MSASSTRQTISRSLWQESHLRICEIVNYSITYPVTCAPRSVADSRSSCFWCPGPRPFLLTYRSRTRQFVYVGGGADQSKSTRGVGRCRLQWLKLPLPLLDVNQFPPLMVNSDFCFPHFLYSCVLRLARLWVHCSCE